MTGPAVVTDRSPRVSVAMITYNHERFIASAITSILGQTFEDFELVVVDDGSSDGTAAVIHEFVDPRIRYIRQENQGPSEARNTALRAARGALLAQMSGDDVAAPERLSRQLLFQAERPNAVMFSHCVFIDDCGERCEEPDQEPLFNRENWPAERTLRRLFLYGNQFLAPSALAETRHFRAVGPYRPQLLQLQDYDMWIRFLLAGYDTFVVPEPLLQYRIRSDRGNLHRAEGSASRCFLERRLILRQFLKIRRAERLAQVFPGIRDLGYPLEDELCPFLLAQWTLLPRFRGTDVQIFGADLLMTLMDDPNMRELIHRRAGFGHRDCFRVCGELVSLDPGPLLNTIRHLEREIAQRDAELKCLQASRSWKLSAPLRQLRSLLQRLQTLGRLAG